MNLQNPTEKTKQPHKIEKYQVIEELGRGAMGCVYKAFDPQMGKFIALKVLLNSKDQEHAQRFIREARAMAKMDHQNIIQVYTSGQDSNCTFFTMDYIEGVSLKEFLKSTKVNIRLFSRIMVKIAKGVAYAHEKGILHRDLKPDNIMMDTNQEPYVMDFGLVKLTGYLLGEDKSLTKKGTIMGTPQYMSPEQARGKKVNHLTDVYALGAIFYEMLAKRPLVEGEGITNIIFNVVHEEPTALRRVNKKLSRDLEIICHKAVAKELSKRYQSAIEFAEDIEKFLNGEIIEARALSIWGKFRKKMHRNKLITTVAITGVLLVVAGIWIFENKQSADVYLYLAKAKKWQRKAANQKVIDKQMETYMEASSFLEKALEISSRNFPIKKKLIKVQKTLGLLAKEQKDYLLSSVSFKQCKSLGDKDAEKLLNELEQEKNQLQKNHKIFISKIMKEIEQKNPQKELINRYVFTIVKMKKPYVIEALVPYLQAASKNQRILAIKALGKFGNTYAKFNKKDTVEWLLSI